MIAEQAAEMGQAYKAIRKYAKTPLPGRDAKHVLSLISADELNALIEARLAARAAKDWAEADRIRDQLAKLGIALKDSPSGTEWELRR